MTSDPVRPGLYPLSQVKAAPTVSGPSLAPLAIPSNAQLPSRSPSRPRHKKTPSRDEKVADPTTDKVTVALIRRVLCPGTGGYGASSSAPQSLEELLPPLTSSNEVDFQLYALLAIIIKEFVYSWYSKITPDHLLVNEIIQVVAHCTRALEQRLRQTNVTQLILDELPALVQSHIVSYRLAQQQSKLSGLPTSLRKVYHALNPHPGLSPVPDPSDSQAIAQQQENEAIYRQLLARGVLTVLLPTEDLENTGLRTFVGDILADLILGNECNSSDQGSNMAQEAPQSRLEKFGLLAVEKPQNQHSLPETQSRVTVWIWKLLQLVYLGYLALRFITTGLLRVASTPAVSVSPTATSPTNDYPTKTIPSTDRATGRRPVLGYSFYGMLSQLLDVPKRMPWLGGLLELCQYLALEGPCRLGDTDSVLDRFLHETIQDYVLTPTLLPKLLVATRTVLFPQYTRPPQASAKASNDVTARASAVSDNHTNNINTPAATPAAPTISPFLPPSPSGFQDHRPSSAEIAVIRRQCATKILSLVPRKVARIFFGLPPAISSPVIGPRLQEAPADVDIDTDRSTVLETTGAAENDDEGTSLLLTAIEDLLDLFADEYCNKHLIYSMLETFLARLLPELSERSVAELMEDRGLS
ncbi:hypothetical protein MPDQ_007579 [Monascus purpureus]|uniref:PXA domain-containing protein n=1 Tax=Monascus purpureus TaxID=5098 RepID=A0A507QW39_MONPU|nr:hypothetical protein MPDQ_007579 [Monascus purpureus]